MQVNTNLSGKSQPNPPVTIAIPRLRRSPAFVIGVITLLAITMVAQKQKDDAPSNVDTAIRAVMDAQVTAWNHHDLEGFMAGYWNSPELTFFSGAAETKGWAPTLERYRRSYQAEGKAMGTLSFSDLQIEALGPDAAFVRGKFELVMPDGKQPHGVFTLIFRKFPDGWRIIHDHTCSG
jgi:ketosteroid isomerase-like protein